MSQRTFARKKASESAVWGANWICFSHLFCIFPFLCLVVPSRGSALTCWRNIRFWMLEGSSEAQMSQLFHCVAQMVSSGCLKPLDGCQSSETPLEGRQCSAKSPHSRSTVSPAFREVCTLNRSFLSSKVRSCSAARACHSSKKHESLHQLTYNET